MQQERFGKNSLQALADPKPMTRLKLSGTKYPATSQGQGSTGALFGQGLGMLAISDPFSRLLLWASYRR